MRTLLVLIALVLLTAVAHSAAPAPAVGRAAVVADHRLASEAGAEVLRAGGNAVDAAIAAALACGVVQPSSSGLGGGGFAVVVGGSTRHVLDFREVAPAAATRHMFLDAEGRPVPGLSSTGGLAVAVPGEGRGLATLRRSHGTLPASRLAEPAIRLASRGFPAGQFMVTSLSRSPELLPRLLRASEPLLPGQRVSRPELAATLRAWARTDGEALHVGPIARDIAAAVQAAGGVLTEADLAAWQPTVREPVIGSYRGHTVVTMPPPSSGGVVLLQALHVLEAWDLPSLGHNSAAHLHLLAEVMKHAYADRANHLGDPAFVDVPVAAMLAPERIDAIRRSFWPDRTLPSTAYGLPVAPPDDAGTQHISVLDERGLAVALTTTVNTAFGAEVVAPASGVLLNDEMDDFATAPGVPNAFGLVGREANAVAPGKKPLSSMTPTVLLDAQGRVVMVVGASGGPFIISSTLQVISNVLDFKMNPSEAAHAPRMHHQWLPELLFVDTGVPRDVQAALLARGHQVREMPFFSSVQAIVQDPAAGTGGWPVQASSDPRKDGEAAVAVH